jgi:flagellar hook-associated protein 3 FlgL
MFRVSQSVFYRQNLYDLLRMNRAQAQLNEQLSSGKRINAPSDDSIGSITAQHSQIRLDQIAQYGKGVDFTLSWLSQSESNMDAMDDILMQARERAEQMATGTYSSEQLQMTATVVGNFYDQLISLANTDIGGRHIFSGTRNDQSAANTQLQIISPSVPDSTNTGPGQLYGQGDYTGLLSRNVSLEVDAGYAGGVPTAANPMQVNVSYVDDYGRTISGSVTLTGVGSGSAVDVGDGVQIYAENRDYTAGDTFTLRVGRHVGNEEQLDVNLSWDNRMRYNYTLNQLFRQEGNSGGSWLNILDMMAKWQDTLLKDNKVQEYFEAVPSVQNHFSTSAELRVSGEWANLTSRDIEFNVGGPIQFHSDLSDATFQGRPYQFYLEDPAYTGVPSADNPMVLHLRYDTDPTAGVTWADGGTITLTGTGPANSVTYVDPISGEDVDIFVANASYDASSIEAWDGTAVPPENQPNAGREFVLYNGSGPSSTNPMPMTYTFTDDHGVRQFNTITFTGTGDHNTMALGGMDLHTVVTGTRETVATDPLGLSGSFEIWVYGETATRRNYTINVVPGDSAQDIANNINAAVAAAVPPGTYPIASVTSEGQLELRSDEGVEFAFANETGSVLTDLGFEFSTTLYLEQGGIADDGDFWSLTLEQYHQGQEASQELIVEFKEAMANLLKYMGDAGGKLNRLEVREKLLDDDLLRSVDLLSQVEDVDVTQAVVDLKTYQNLYQATLQATAAVSSRTLADYL